MSQESKSPRASETYRPIRWKTTQFRPPHHHRAAAGARQGADGGRPVVEHDRHGRPARARKGATRAEADFEAGLRGHEAGRSGQKTGGEVREFVRKFGIPGICQGIPVNIDFTWSTPDKFVRKFVGLCGVRLP